MCTKLYTECGCSYSDMCDNAIEDSRYVDDSV